MKKSTFVSALAVLAAAIMLSGCIFPYWGDEGGGRGGSYHEGHGGEGHHDGEGRHDGGERH